MVNYLFRNTQWNSEISVKIFDKRYTFEKMASERNKDTEKALKREIKDIRASCVNACNIIDNAPPEPPVVNPDEISEQTLCYIEGLRTEIQNSNTAITTDCNLLTSQFLHEIKQKTGQIEELTAFTRGCIIDVDIEINRLKTLINIAKEAKSKPRLENKEVTREHVQKAKDRFHLMKSELHGLITSLFPKADHLLSALLGELMVANLNDTSNGYLPITSENYTLIELLKDLNIVTANPYNNMEVKLAY